MIFNKQYENTFQDESNDTILVQFILIYLSTNLVKVKQV